MSGKKGDKAGKQGEDRGITKTAKDEDKDFKDTGIEGTKGDEIQSEESAELYKVKAENARLKSENDLLKTKNDSLSAKKEEVEKKDYVTGEDVIKSMRVAGKKI